MRSEKLHQIRPELLYLVSFQHLPDVHRIAPHPLAFMGPFAVAALVQQW